LSRFVASLPRIFHALVIVLTPTCAFPSPAQEAKPPAKQSVPAPTEKNAAQIELLETKYRFESDGDSRKEVHARVRINNELGARQFARLNFDFNRSFQSVEIPFVRVTHAGGGTADILPSAITDNPNPAVIDYPAYHDVRVKSVRILGLQPDDTLEYRVITTTTHHPLAPDFWLDHSFERSGIVSLEHFELDLPGRVNSTATMGRTFGGHPVVYLGVPYTSYQNPGEGNYVRSVYRWEISPARKLPPADDLDGVPSPDVIVSSFSSWFDLVARVAPRFPNWTEDDRKDAEIKLRSILPGTSAPDEVIRASYEFVSQKMATVDLPIGATGFQVRHVKQILDSGYATPEEKCLLLSRFANLAGSFGDAVFVGSAKAFARPSVFSHAFVFLRDKNKEIALDPSLEVAPYGLIPPQFRGKEALSLKLADSGNATGVLWSELPTVLAIAASQRVNVDSAISAEGKLEAKVRYTLRGDNELMLRVAFHQTSKEKWKDVAQMLALSDGFRGQIVNVVASDPYATKEPFSVEYEISQPKFVDWSKKTIRIPAILPLPGLPDPPTAAQTSSGKAIELGTPLAIDLNATIKLPAGATAQAPIGTAVTRDYATFSSKYSAQGNTLHATRSLHFISSELPASRAADLNAFLHAVQSDQTQLFSVQPAPQK
jgi:hypothetical protein